MGPAQEGDGILKRRLTIENDGVMAVNDSIVPVYGVQDVEGSERLHEAVV